VSYWQSSTMQLKLSLRSIYVYDVLVMRVVAHTEACTVHVEYLSCCHLQCIAYIYVDRLTFT
jgi:hypothetical protein